MIEELTKDDKRRLKQADGWFYATENYQLLPTKPGGKAPEAVKGAVLAYSTATGLSRRMTSVPNMVSKLMGNFPAEIQDNLVVAGKTTEVVTVLG